MGKSGKAIIGFWLGVVLAPVSLVTPAAAQNAIETAFDGMVERFQEAAGDRFHIAIQGRKGNPAAGTLDIDYLRLAWNKGRHAVELSNLSLTGVKVADDQLTGIAGLTSGRVRLETGGGGVSVALTAVGAQGKTIAIGDMAGAIGGLAEDAGAARVLVALLDGLSAESLAIAGTTIKISHSKGFSIGGGVETLGIANLADGKADMAMRGLSMGGDMAKMAVGPQAPRRMEITVQTERAAYRQVDLRAYAALMDVYVDFVAKQVAVSPSLTAADSLLLLKANVINMVKMGDLIKNLSYGPGTIDKTGYRVDMEINDTEGMSWAGSVDSIADAGFANGVAKGLTFKKFAITLGGSAPALERMAGNFRIREMRLRGFDVHGYMMRMAQLTAFFVRMAGADLLSTPQVSGQLLEHLAMGGMDFDLSIAATPEAGAPFTGFESAGGMEVFLIDGLGRGMAERVALKNARFSANAVGQGFVGATTTLFDARMATQYMDLSHFRYGPMLDMIAAIFQTGAAAVQPSAGLGLKDKPTMVDISKKPIDPTAVLSYVRRSVLKGFTLDVTVPQFTLRTAMESDLGMTPDMRAAKGAGAMRVVVQVPKNQPAPEQFQVALGPDNTLDMTVRYNFQADVPTRRVVQAINVTAADLANLRLAMDFSGVEYFWRTADFALLDEAEMQKALMSPLGFGNAMMHGMELSQEDTGLLARLVPYLAKQQGLPAEQAIDAWVDGFRQQAEALYPGDALVKEFADKLTRFLKNGGRFSLIFKPAKPVPAMAVAGNVQTHTPQMLGRLLGLDILHSAK